MRRRTLRRWALPAFAGLALIAALAVVVRRGEEARLLSAELSALRSQEEIARDRLAEETARVDSLGSLERLEEAAGALGLRRAHESEVSYLADVEQAGNGPREKGAATEE